MWQAEKFYKIFELKRWSGARLKIRRFVQAVWSAPLARAGSMIQRRFQQSSRHTNTMPRVTVAAPPPTSHSTDKDGMAPESRAELTRPACRPAAFFLALFRFR